MWKDEFCDPECGEDHTLFSHYLITLSKLNIQLGYQQRKASIGKKKCFCKHVIFYNSIKIIILTKKFSYSFLIIFKAFQRRPEHTAIFQEVSIYLAL